MILTILKIIGMILLAALGLVLILLLLVLFVPLRYHVKGSYHGKPWVRVRITWLLRLLSVSATYEDSLELLAKVLWLKLFPREKRTQPGGEEYKEDGSPAEVDGQGAVMESSWDADSPGNGGDADSPEDGNGRGADDEKGDGDGEEGSELESGAIEGGRPKPDTDGNAESGRAKAGGRRIKDRLEQLWQFFMEEENRKTLRLIFRQVKAVLRHLLPRRIRADVVFGFDNPATTGQVLAICSLVYAWYGESIRLTPVFDEKILEAQVEIKGRVRLGTLLVLALRVLFNKNFRVLVKRWRMNGGI